MPMRRQALKGSAAHKEPNQVSATATTQVARVVIIDDHVILCEGLRCAFEASDDFTVVGSASDRLGALEVVGEEIPDLVLLDVNIPGSGIETARQLSFRYPSTKILMLSAYDDEYYIGLALRAGASGYLLKGIEAGELLDAARQVLAGDCLMPVSVAERMLDSSRTPPVLLDDANTYQIEMTEREEDILRFITQGRSNSEIAKNLGLTERTVKHYVSNILQKLHVCNRVEAALIGYDRIISRFHNDD